MNVTFRMTELEIKPVGKFDVEISGMIEESYIIELARELSQQQIISELITNPDEILDILDFDEIQKYVDYSK